MSDPFTGWLSYVGLLVTLAVPIFVSVAKILRCVDDMLGSVLSMCNRVRRFRRAKAPAATRKRAVRCLTRKHGSQGPGVPT